MIKTLKKLGIAIVGVLLLLFLTAFLFVSFSPQFGASLTKEQKALFESSVNYSKGKFINKGNVNLNMSFSDMRKGFIGFFNPLPYTIPKENIEVVKIDSLNIAQYKGETRLIWFGHSTFLLQIEDHSVLIDPMFGKVPAPHPWLGTKRFSNELPIEIDELPKIDAVLISHDHYDHLDYGSIQKLKEKVNMFYTPLGVGAHLEEWGIEKTRIVELDWWQNASFEDLTFTCTPAQHFSGRGINDRSDTLWSSWVINSNSENIFFSGDSGYGPHFKEIGERYGPFDFAMLECGQYNKLWSEIHMFPEETVQAGLDVKARIIMPIHWGAFKLAMHPWKDPIERVSKKAEGLEITLFTPRIGEIIKFSDLKLYKSKWWE